MSLRRVFTRRERWELQVMFETVLAEHAACGGSPVGTMVPCRPRPALLLPSVQQIPVVQIERRPRDRFLILLDDGRTLAVAGMPDELASWITVRLATRRVELCRVLKGPGLRRCTLEFAAENYSADPAVEHRLVPVRSAHLAAA